MAPTIPSAKIYLSCPLYSASFDPNNYDFLLVGGGGGEGRSGVGNKIYLLDTSKRDDISEVLDIDLSRNEDSVTSLAVVQSSESSAIALAGINSSEANQKAGKNEHLRCFELKYPPRKLRTAEEAPAERGENRTEDKGQTSALGQLSLFTPSSAVKKETYQRVLRLSPSKGDGDPRLAAIATGLAPEGEIVVFSAYTPPSQKDELGRINLGKGEEAADVDFMEEEDGNFQIAYCTNYEVFVYKVPGLSEPKSQSKPQFVAETPPPDAFSESPIKPKFRGIRFLTPKHLLLLRNRPGREGADLLLLSLGSSGSLGTITLEKHLHRSMKAAIGLDVCILSTSPSGEKQIIIAVAGQDHSIELITLEFSPTSGLSSFRPYTILRDVPSSPMTKICFSNFIPPALPATAGTRPQYVKLASVGVSNIVIVHTLPLLPYPAGNEKYPRYVLVRPGTPEAISTTFSVFMAIVVVGIAAFLLQAFTEIRGGMPPTLGATEWLSPRLKELIARPYVLGDSSSLNTPIIPSNIPSVNTVKTALRDLVSQQSEQETPKAIIVRDEGTDLSTEVHHDEEIVKREARKWEDLHEHEKESWKRKLIDAGHWAVEEGETVLKGVFFSELAGIVGDAIRG